MGDRLLISGSRDASARMRDYARACVLRALENGWFILAGDAPGIDQVVAETVRDHFTHEDELMFGMRIYGLGAVPRHGVTSPRIHYKHVTAITETIVQRGSRDLHVYDVKHPLNYTERDKLMVREADKVLCIWNGRSRGTPAVYEYALAMGKVAWLREDTNLSIR